MRFLFSTIALLILTSGETTFGEISSSQNSSSPSISFEVLLHQFSDKSFAVDYLIPAEPGNRLNPYQKGTPDRDETPQDPQLPDVSDSDMDPDGDDALSPDLIQFETICPQRRSFLSTKRYHRVTSFCNFVQLRN